MFDFSRRTFLVKGVLVAVTAAFVFSVGCAKNEPAWKAVNDKIIKEKNVKIRERSDLVETGVTPSLEPGKVTTIDSLKVIEFAPGVTGKMYWGKGALVNIMTMAPNSEIPEETIPGERLMVMMKGSVEQLVNGEFVKMEYTDVKPGFYFSTGYTGYRHALYLETGAKNAVKAGPEGAEFIEVYYPVRFDYMQKAGVTPPEKTNFGNYTPKLRFEANKVFNFHDVQRTELSPGAWSQLFNNKGAQASFLFMDPNSQFDYHNHPEEQLMIVLGGATEEFIMDQKVPMKKGDILYLPGQMVHGGINSPQGCEVLDVFFPVRPDYQEKEDTRYAEYNKIVPEGEVPQLVADAHTATVTNSKAKPAFVFGEGSAWLDGKYYFSSMFFDIPAGTWKSDASKSNMVMINPADNSLTYVIQKMQTNGMAPRGNGNLVVCNMAGHQVLEVSPAGKIVKVLADKMEDGSRIDGPNDVAVDAKGGIYFTDPQFIFDGKKQPGKTVNYITPEGKVIRVIEPGVIGMPNGIELSPDGKVFYVNNCYHNENNMSDVENWVTAFDVNDDGTLTNKRKFCKMFLHSTEYEMGTRSSVSDGSTVDELGNLYQCTALGIQIFNPQGAYIGNIYLPTFPVNCCFGGENNDTIYVAGWDKVYKIKTNVKGLAPLYKPAK